MVHTSKILGTMTNYICTIPTIQHSTPMNMEIQVNTDKVIPVHATNTYRGVETNSMNHS